MYDESESVIVEGVIVNIMCALYVTKRSNRVLEGSVSGLRRAFTDRKCLCAASNSGVLLSGWVIVDAFR